MTAIILQGYGKQREIGLIIGYNTKIQELQLCLVRGFCKHYLRLKQICPGMPGQKVRCDEGETAGLL